MKFKIGDKVITKVSHNYAPSRYNHTKGVITGTGHNPEYKVKFEDGDCWCYAEDELELQKYTFKAGDKVKILPTENVKSWWSGHKAIGKIRTITEADVQCLKNCGSYHLNDNEFGINFKPSDLELVESKTKFKADDKIIILESCPGSEKKGQRTTLVDTGSGALRTEGHCMHEEYWKKVEPQTRKEETMKVGDRVKLFRKDSYSNMEVGSIGTVIEKYDSDNLTVNFDGTKQIIGIKNLRKVEDMKFKVGDRVRSEQPGERYTGTIISIDSDYARVKRDKHGKGDAWLCRVKGNKIATAAGCWDDKSYLTKIGESMKFIVVDNDDQVRVVNTKEEAQERVEYLVEDLDQDIDYIEVYQVAKEFEVKKAGIKLVEKE